MAVAVRELPLDLDAFEGPFDLLLTLVLREELELRDVDVVEIVVTFVESRVERGELDLEACGEFLVLVAALLELKARGLFPGEELDLEGLDPEEAAEELAERLAAYRRFRAAAGWLDERLAAESDRYFRVGLGAARARSGARGELTRTRPSSSSPFALSRLCRRSPRSGTSSSRIRRSRAS